MNICGDCGIIEGELHLESCDHEHCSKCGKQVLAWGKCEGAKPEPFFEEVFSCVRCGKTMPNLFMVSNEEWEFICGVTYDKKGVLCKPCMDFIRKTREKWQKKK